MTTQEKFDLLEDYEQAHGRYIRLKDIVVDDSLAEAFGVNIWCVNEGADGDVEYNVHERLCELDDMLLDEKTTTYSVTVIVKVTLTGEEKKHMGVGNKTLTEIFGKWAEDCPSEFLSEISNPYVIDTEVAY